MRRLLLLALFPALIFAQPSGSVQTLSIGKGGTGATNAAAARENLQIDQAIASYLIAHPPSGGAWGSIAGSITSQTDLIALFGTKVSTSITVNGHALSGNVSVTASDVGLGSVNDTADSAKPVSTFQAAADAAVQAYAIQRSNHTGSQLAATISDFASTATSTINGAGLNLTGTGLRSANLFAFARTALGGTSGAQSIAWGTKRTVAATGTITISFTGTEYSGSSAILEGTWASQQTLNFPASTRNGQSASTIATLTIPAGKHTFRWEADGSGNYTLTDTVPIALAASAVSVSATPTNYTAATPDVEAHLSGIDSKLGTLGSGGSGSSLSPGTITQASHGFVVGDFVYRGASNWAKAKSDSFSTVAIPYFVSAVTTNAFTPVAAGKVDITGLGYTAGSYRYLSDATAGQSTATAPTAAGSFTVAVLYCESATVGFVNPPLPMTNSSGLSIKTTTYTATPADSVIVANSGTPFTIMMYNATATNAQPLTIKNKGAGTITVDATSLGTIDGSNTITLLQGDAVDLVSDGTVWNVK